MEYKEPQKNTFGDKIEKLNSEYSGKPMFPMGKVEKVSFSDLGKTLIIYLTGDISTNFKEPNVIIVHPDSEKDGWIGKGKIGFTLEGKGIDITKIPLPEETISIIKNIYQEYVGKELREPFYRENDTNKFAVMGFYKNILDKERK